MPWFTIDTAKYLRGFDGTERSYFRAIEQDEAKGRASAKWQMRGIDPGLSPWWQAVRALDRCDNIIGAMTDWERRFVRDLNNWNKPPTERQLKFLWEIVGKVIAWSEEPVRRTRGAR